MRIGLDVAQHQLLWPELAERVQFAESAAFDGAWVFDHFSPLYGDPNGPCLEGWTLLAGLAAVTSRIRLGVLVTGITYRHPSVLATEAITVDHISKGRLELGLGAAWHQPEHEALGIPFPPLKERAERLEEGVQAIRLLMTKDRATRSAAAPACLDRRGRRAGDVADRRPPGRRLACLRLRRFDGPQIPAARP